MKTQPERQLNVVRFQTIVSTKDLDSWGPRIAELEAFATYQLGDDAFKLVHGVDYFNFLGVWERSPLISRSTTTTRS
ncbi:MAG: hypothetical protein GY822_19520 [Deltaproteobacteria bacterium]|nr:hypothetical protein [Deltaproteobacteria bacterium]